jgi:hypothetical protein
MAAERGITSRACRCAASRRSIANRDRQPKSLCLREAIVSAFDDFDHASGYSGKTERTLMSSALKYELFADMGR